eukprot:TRINITY_DN30578_c1_g2_i1.p1 TRINITY_DN30578_c1_g2~~TRINITY_DN30578_c1_g2_i1.p1  ORF type:complete len:350 (+),score=100.14 TRINITY_DN30578_c1_g2_i1:64-1050(+)
MAVYYYDKRGNWRWERHDGAGDRSDGARRGGWQRCRGCRGWRRHDEDLGDMAYCGGCGGGGRRLQQEVEELRREVGVLKENIKAQQEEEGVWRWWMEWRLMSRETLANVEEKLNEKRQFKGNGEYADDAEEYCGKVEALLQKICGGLLAQKAVQKSVEALCLKHDENTEATQQVLMEVLNEAKDVKTEVLKVNEWFDDDVQFGGREDPKGSGYEGKAEADDEDYAGESGPSDKVDEAIDKMSKLQEDLRGWQCEGVRQRLRASFGAAEREEHRQAEMAERLREKKSAGSRRPESERRPERQKRASREEVTCKADEEKMKAERSPRVRR